MEVFEWKGFLLFLGYYIVTAGTIAILSHIAPKGKELARKGYHLMACFSALILVFAFENWLSAITTLLVFAGLVYLVLPIANLIPALKKLSIQRYGKFREVLKQAGFFFITLGLLITIIWGLLGSDYKIHIIVGIIVLGLGDAAAALIGKRFGKKKFKLRLFDAKKTLEGSSAMAIAAFIGAFLVLIIFTDTHILLAFFSAIFIALLSAFVEATCTAGLDTIFIPLVISFISIILAFINGSIERWWLL